MGWEDGELVIGALAVGTGPAVLDGYSKIDIFM